MFMFVPRETHEVCMHMWMHVEASSKCKIGGVIAQCMCEGSHVILRVLMTLHDLRDRPAGIQID